jgi:hypothetical protein
MAANADDVFVKSPPISPELADDPTLSVQKDSYFVVRDGKKEKLNGVPISQCYYRLWLEYLKRNEKYVAACKNNGKGLRTIYKDFGDVLDIDSDQQFWDWWVERGQTLFGSSRHNSVPYLADSDSLPRLIKDIKHGTVSIIAIPNGAPKTKVRQAVNEILKQLDVSAKYANSKYSFNSDKVTIDNLKDALYAYDLHSSGKSALEIGVLMKFSNRDQINDLLEDARRRRREYIDNPNTEFTEHARKKKSREIAVKRASTKAWRIVNHRNYDYYTDPTTKRKIRRWHDDSKKYMHVTKLIDIYLGIKIRKSEPERVKNKKVAATFAKRLIVRAERNIAAVQEGIFCVT